MKHIYYVIFTFCLSTCFLSSYSQDTVSTPLMKLKGHTEDIEVITYSPDGLFIASAGWDGKIKVWFAETGDEYKTFKAHDASVRCLAFNRFGNYAISGARDNSVKIWDSLWNLKYSLYGHQNIINTVQLDPKMKSAFSGSDDGTVKLWDLKKKGESRNLKKFERPVNAIVLSNAGADIFVATQGPDIVKLSMTGEVKETFTGHTDEVNALAYSLNNKYLLSGSSDKTAIIWDVVTGKELHVLKSHTWKVTSVAFSYDCKYAVTGSTDGTVKLWEVETGKLLRTFRGGNTAVTALSISPDITRIASAGMVNSFEPDANKYLLYIWPTGLELESAKTARLRRLREDSLRRLKDSIRGVKDSMKLADSLHKDSLKKAGGQPKKDGETPKKDTPKSSPNPGGAPAMLKEEEDNY